MEPVMGARSVWAIGAGVLVIVVGSTLVDLLLHLAGVFPPMGQPIDDALALLATSPPHIPYKSPVFTFWPSSFR
jgi:hypothetical protein